MKNHKLVLIPKFLGSFEHIVDKNNRVSLPSIIRETIIERNKYNRDNEYFNVVRDPNGHYALAFKCVPFAAVKPNESVTKKDISVSGLDKLVYVGTGTIKGNQPEFFTSDADTIFIYAVTDAQRMLYDKDWSNGNFNSNHRVARIDPQGRITLNQFERSICADSGHIQLSTRETLEDELVRRKTYTIITGHPSLFCATLTNRYQPTL